MFKISFNYAQHHVCFTNFSLNMFAKRRSVVPTRICPVMCTVIVKLKLERDINLAHFYHTLLFEKCCCRLLMLLKKYKLTSMYKYIRYNRTCRAGSRNFRAKGTFALRHESSSVPGLGLGLCSLARKFTGKKVLRRESSLGTKVP